MIYDDKVITFLMIGGIFIRSIDWKDMNHKINPEAGYIYTVYLVKMIIKFTFFFRSLTSSVEFNESSIKFNEY